MGQVISVRPSTFAEGGGLLDDADVVFQGARFTMYDYGGKSTYKVPVLAVGMVVDGEDEVHEQYYSVGGKNDFAPSEDGKSLMATGSKQSVVKGSNFGEFMQSLVAAGFPESQMKDDDIGFLNGVHAHVKRKALDRKGLDNAGKKEQTTLLVEKLLGEVKAKGGAKGGAKGKSAEVDAELAEFTSNVIVGILANNDGTMAKKDLLTPVLKLDEVKAHPKKANVIKLVTNDEFLGGISGVTYADGKLTLE